MGKFNLDCIWLLLLQCCFGGVVGCIMVELVGDWLIVFGFFLFDDVLNVLIVLIDDVGFGGLDIFGGVI